MNVFASGSMGFFAWVAFLPTKLAKMLRREMLYGSESPTIYSLLSAIR